MLRPLSLLLSLCCVHVSVSAAQIQPRTLYSPINKKPFQVNIIPFNAQTLRNHGNDTPANMGIDSDGCRHHANFSEYDHYIVTCPYSFFTAMSAEWNERNGRFTQPLDRSFVSWLRSGKGLNTMWITTRNQKFKMEQERARLTGKDIGTVNDYVIPQDQIAIDKKYNYALKCYAKRNARAAFMAKVSLTGAWAIRVHMNRQLADPDLEGGVKELNARIDRHIKEGEEFSLKKWHKVFTNVFKNTKLSDEAYFVAGSTLLGLEMRVGSYKECDAVIAAMAKRFQNLEHGEKLRGIVRERRSKLDTYRTLLDSSVVYFAQAIANEEIRRVQLPTTMIAVAEGLRRTNYIDQAIDWYIAVDELDETEPALRKEIKKMGKAPAPHAPTLVHIGWQAHKKAEELMKYRPGREWRVIGQDAPLLNAIVNKGLGTSEHENPQWEAVSGAAVKELEVMLSELGKALVDHEFRFESWPEKLGNLWDKGTIPDWNRFNRFHCPVTGASFRYAAPKIKREKLPTKTVLIACSRPVTTIDGPRYLNYLANNSLVWSKQPLQPATRAP